MNEPQSSNRRVLIVAYYFPPSGGPGVQRVLKFVKYLPEFGWEPAVLTVQDADYPARDESLLKEIPKGVPVVRTKIPEPYTIYRALTGKAKGSAVDVNVNSKPGEKRALTERIAEWVRGSFFVPDARVGWLMTGVGAGARLAKEFGADLVYSSSPPYTCALLGRKIGRRAGIPWVPEFRDPWSGFLSAPDRPFLSERLEHRMERGVYRDAPRIAIAWRGIAKDLQAKYPEEDVSKFALIENGFDPADLDHAGATANKKFTIVYTGSMYGVRNPDTFLKAVAQLRTEQKIDPESVCLRFVGRFGDEVHAMFARPEVADMVEVVPYLPHSESIAQAKGAHALLLVVDDYRGAEGIVPGKVFEYIGCERPVLALAPEGAVAEIVRRTHAGEVLGQHDIKGTAEAVHRLFEEWKNTGTTAFPGEANEVKALSRRERTRALASLFHEVVEKHGKKTTS
ncbi:MAG: glycosyltransferase [Candidatus Eisenbacteria bacterium]|uniref:Glycosyltransferase n=1 Tax=Eiseniibacteriota bacterium TaxID=2212470 RepID=A0A7Y2H2G9_UNCEI|nr:glycosyltransferase [Candidatus Eisenbacteria bacterium]